MKALRKILNIIIDVFIIIVVVLSVVIASISISSRNTGVPNLFGYVPLSVQTESMSPTFSVGDLIIGKKVDSTFNFKVGDVITYWTIVRDTDNVGHTVLNTHRIVEITKDLSGTKCFVTKGDHNNAKDSSLVNVMDVVSVWQSGNQTGTKIAKLGSVLTYLKSPNGFLVCVVIPMAVFFIYELFRFVYNLLNYNKAKSREAALEAAKEVLGNSASDSSGLSEEQKTQAILEYMEKQKKSASKDGKDSQQSQTMEDDDKKS